MVLDSAFLPEHSGGISALNQAELERSQIFYDLNLLTQLQPKFSTLIGKIGRQREEPFFLLSINDFGEVAKHALGTILEGGYGPRKRGWDRGERADEKRDAAGF